MPTKVLVAYYSTYDHIYQMAQAVVEGVNSVEQTKVAARLRELRQTQLHSQQADAPAYKQ